jgi:F-type H+-transporting ATPase subunit g
VIAYREPILYDLAVARELFKQVYIAERLAPPTSFAEIKTAYSTIFGRIRNINYWREMLRSGDWVKIGLYALEAYGIFKVSDVPGNC